MNQCRTQVVTMHQEIVAAISSFRQFCTGQFTMINNNVRRHGGTIQGAFARQANPGAANVQQEPQQAGAATLSPMPRTLHELWNEWEYGIGGRKPAKNFTRQERGNRAGGIKQKYYRRNKFWKWMCYKIRSGRSVDACIHLVRQTYGHRKSVTKILEDFIKDGPNYHDNLR